MNKKLFVWLFLVVLLIPVLAYAQTYINGNNITTGGNISGATYGSDASVSDAELLFINSLSSNVQTQIKSAASYGAHTYIVDPTGTAGAGSYTTIGSALAAIPDKGVLQFYTPSVILLSPGYYFEQVTIDKGYITIKGMAKDEVTWACNGSGVTGPMVTINILAPQIANAVAIEDITVRLNSDTNRVMGATEYWCYMANGAAQQLKLTNIYAHDMGLMHASCYGFLKAVVPSNVGIYLTDIYTEHQGGDDEGTPAIRYTTSNPAIWIEGRATTKLYDCYLHNITINSYDNLASNTGGLYLKNASYIQADTLSITTNSNTNATTVYSLKVEGTDVSQMNSSPLFIKNAVLHSVGDALVTTANTYVDLTGVKISNGTQSIAGRVKSEAGLYGKGLAGLDSFYDKHGFDRTGIILWTSTGSYTSYGTNGTWINDANSALNLTGITSVPTYSSDSTVRTPYRTFNASSSDTLATANYNDIALQTGKLTVGAWVNIANDDITKPFLGNVVAATGGLSWGLGIDSYVTDTVNFQIRGNSNGYYFRRSAINLLNDWHLIVGVWDGTVPTDTTGMAIYSDGVSVSTTSASTNGAWGTALKNTTAPIRVGYGNFSGDTIQMKIGECLIMNRELTAAEILAWYEKTRWLYGK